MGFQERWPRRRSLAIRCGFNAMGLEHVGYRGVGNVETDVGRRTLNTIVSPGRILPGEANDGIHHNLPNAWPTGFAFVAGVELLRHEFAMPAENRVWRDDRGEFQESLAINGVSFHSEQPTLVAVEQQSLPADRFQQRLDLSVLELDDLLLTLVHQTAEAGQQDVPWRE